LAYCKSFAVFNDHFVANLLHCVLVKEFGKVITVDKVMNFDELFFIKCPTFV